MKRQDGFTLIELMVTILVIGILIAIGLPTFLGAKTRAQDRSAQSAARNGLTTAKVCYADDGSYMDCDTVTLATIEPNLTFVDISTSDSEVSVAPNILGMGIAALSDSGTCWMIYDSTTAITFGSRAGNCDAADASAVATDPGW